MSGSVQQQQSSQQHRKKKQIIIKKKTFDSVTAECELILWYVLWRNNVLFYLSRLIPDLTVRSTSYESSLTKKTKTNTSDCYSLRCNARVKMLWDHLNIPPTSLRQKKKKTPSWLTTTGKPWETTGNPSKTTNQFGTAEASSGYPPGCATEWIFPPDGWDWYSVNSLKWIIATLVGEAPLFSHRLLLLVTSTGFRSCQRQRIMSVMLNLLWVNLKMAFIFWQMAEYLRCRGGQGAQGMRAKVDRHCQVERCLCGGCGK